MATVTIREDNRVLQDSGAISEFLGQYGIWYRHFEGSDKLPENATNEEILASYDEPIQVLMKEGGFKTADVINVTSDTPDLQAFLQRKSG